MAEGVYKIVEVVGVSEKSWEDAGRIAVETAAGSLRDLRVAEVTKLDMKVEDGKVAAFRTRVSLSFKIRGRVGMAMTGHREPLPVPPPRRPVRSLRSRRGHRIMT